MQLVLFELCHRCLQSVFRPSADDTRLPEVLQTTTCDHLTCSSCAASHHAALKQRRFPSAPPCPVIDCGAAPLPKPIRRKLLDFIEAKQKIIRSFFPEYWNPGTLQQRCYVNISSANRNKTLLSDLEFVRRNSSGHSTFVFLNDLLANIQIDPGTIRADWTAFGVWCRTRALRFVQESSWAQTLEDLLHSLTTFSLWDLKFPLGRFRIERCFQQFRVQSEGLRLISRLLKKIVSQVRPSLPINLLGQLQQLLGDDEQRPVLIPDESSSPSDPAAPAFLPLLEGSWPPELPQFASPFHPSIQPTRRHVHSRRALHSLNFHRRTAILRRAVTKSTLLQPRDASFLGQCFPGLRDIKFTLSLGGLDLSTSQAFVACTYMEQVLLIFKTGGATVGVYREKQLAQEAQDFSASSFFLWVAGRRVWHPRPIDFSQGNFRFPEGFPVFGCKLNSPAAPKRASSEPVHIQTVYPRP